MGRLVAQATHAALDFAQKYPALTSSWMADSNVIHILEASSEEDLLDWCDALVWKWECPHAVFYEPDLKAHTAVAFMALTDHSYPGHIQLEDLITRIPLLSSRKGVIQHEQRH